MTMTALLNRSGLWWSEALHVFTSAAVNYLPKVRILCRSIRQHHPEAVIHLALADERPKWLRTEDEPFDSILGIERLGIPDYRNWTFTHSIVELSTAIKPFALKHLLQLPDCGTVLYFDPDMALFSRVDDILETLKRSNLALTPHQTKPEQTMEAIFDNEVASLKHGIFNLGFIGVSNTAEGRRFTDWWSQRTYSLCWADVENGLFTDQKWVNFAPVFFDGVAIVKSSRHNVATWNLTTRPHDRQLRVRRSSRRRAARLLSLHGLRQRRASDHGDQECAGEPGRAGADLVVRGRDCDCRSRSDQRVALGVRAVLRRHPIEPAHRRIYRDRSDLQKAFPEPYDAANPRSSFLGWCQSEGVLRHPEWFGNGGKLPGSSRLRTSVSLPMALRLFRLALSPKSGKALRSRAKAVLKREGLGGVRAAAPWTSHSMIDVIIPVYKGLWQTRRCIESVLANRQATTFEIVAVDDASPEADITSYLDDLAAARRITLARNERNLGFVQSVNRGMSLHAERDVVLLNSDTEVANDWLDRLCRSAYAYPDVGTVTPFSNNATICSYPFEGWTGGVPGTLGVAELDRLFASTNAGRTVDLPTAVGFCMLIRRACLDRIGPFDAERFGSRLRRGERFLHARGGRRLAQRARRRRVRLSRGRR
jgi:hypothetical protein